MSPENFSSLLREAGSFKWHDQEPALNEAVDEFHVGIEDNFSKARDSQGVAWAPHAPSTIAKYGVHPLLILKTPMKTAATGGDGAVRLVMRADGKLVAKLGIEKAKIVYYRVHQHGWQDEKNPNRKIPKREYYYLSSENRPKVVAKFRKSVVEKGTLPAFVAKVIRK